MRLTGLHVEGFGKLSGLECRLDAPVTVVYGRNEAGKSTLLAFIRAMLYGFAHKGNPAERLEPVHGGRHGGRLFFDHHDGSGYLLERYGSSSGKIHIRRLGSSGEGNESSSDRIETLTQAVWERQFLGGIGERLFRELFAISLSELQAIGMLEGDELGKQLYHAGWNGGNAIAKTEKLLSGQLDGLYRPRGSTQQMNKLLKTLDDIDAQLRQAEDGITAFNELSLSLADFEAEQAVVEQDLPGLREQTGLLLRAIELREAWLGREALLREQEALSDAPRLASDARTKMEALASELARCRAAEQLAADGMDQHARQLAELMYDEELIARAADIESLLFSAEHIDASRQHAAELMAELREHEEAVERLLERISPGWTAQELRDLPLGVVDREAIRAFRTSLLEVAKSVSAAQAELRAAAQQAAEGAAQLAELDADAERSGLAGSAAALDFELLPDSVEALRLAVRELDEAWHELELAQLRVHQEQEAARDVGSATPLRLGGGVYWAAVGVAAAGAAALAAAGEPVAAAVAGAAAAVLAAGPALARLAGPGPGRAARSGAAGRGSRRRAGRGRGGAAHEAAAPAVASALADAERRVAAAVRRLVREPEAALQALLARGPAAAAAPPPHTPQAEMAAAYRQAAAARAGGATGPAQLLARLRAAADARQDALRLRAGAAERRGELARRHARLRAQEEAARAAAEHAALAAEAIADRWRDWLHQCGLPAQLTPEGAAETFDLAEQALHRLQAHGRAAGKHARLQTDIAAFEAAAERLAAAFPAAAGRAHGDAFAAVRALHAEAERHIAASARAAELRARLAELEREAARQAASIAELEGKQLQWYRAAQAEDELQWLAALQRAERLADLETELYKLEAELTAGLTSRQREMLADWYAVCDANQLAAMRQASSRELDRLEARRSELLELIGRKRQQLEQLLQSGDRARLIMEREQATAALEQLIHRYAVRALGMTMIRRTKRIMEEQRQPGVLREASRLMSRLSEGRYKRISMPEGEQRIALETGDGRLVESKLLSRGTAEQLYLAMRLALADEAASAHELPLLLDDPLVNFDLARQKAAIEVLHDLAKRRQIVLFTCHDHMRELALSGMPEAQLIILS
ncbi:AAA family ATPase [Paenibacillus silvisoli]|uniref:AAA family ATPase n=1 Tax=Paenibacillus silvisoli TaxID=3110539 RepID=UPI00280456CF|nr:AAA family ATPase [Paenibacillus silvisoli]